MSGYENIITSVELQNILPIAARNTGHFDPSKNAYVGNPIETLDDVVYYYDNVVYPIYQVMTNNAEYSQRVANRIYGQTINYNIGLLTHGQQPVLTMNSCYNLFDLNAMYSDRMIMGFRYYCTDPNIPPQLFQGHNNIMYRSNNGVGAGVYWEIEIMGRDYGHTHTDDYGYVYDTEMFATQYYNNNATEPIPISFFQWAASNSVLPVPVACILFNDQLYPFFPTIPDDGHNQSSGASETPIDTSSNTSSSSTGSTSSTDSGEGGYSGGNPVIVYNPTASSSYYPMQSSAQTQSECQPEYIIRENITYNYCTIV